MATTAEKANVKVKVLVLVCFHDIRDMIMLCVIQYDPLFSLLQDYSEVVIQFGYTALFASALPIASCIAFITNTVWIKGLIWKLFHVFQRPVPSGAQDIGFWQDILLIIATVSVVTNAGLIVFTMSTLNRYSDAFRFWTFILFQWVCLAIQV
jgi:anoctamin-10/anoctamin-7